MKILKKLSRTALNLIKDISYIKIARFFLYAFVFFLPFNINAVVYTTGTYDTGNFNSYTSFFIYLCDFFLALSIIAFAIAVFKNEFKEKLIYGKTIIFALFILFLIAAEISIFFAHEKTLSILIFVRLFECILLYFMMINKAASLDKIINVFIASVSIQALFAILQYLFQGSLGLGFLGESTFSSVSSGIAKINMLTETIVRPYGTFPHSNILAGFLTISIILTFYKVLNKEHVAFPLLLLQIGALILTFSRTAFVALVISWFVYISVKNTKIPYKLILVILFSLILFVVIFNLEDLILNRILFTDITSLNERVFYFNISKSMLVTAPFGIGLGNFTYLMQDFADTKLAPWDFQPVHNIYLLIANEAGLQGLIIFVLLLIFFGILIFIKMKKSHYEQKKLGVILLCTLAAYFVIGLFDHYLFSLYQGLMLSFFVFGLYGRYVIEENR